MRQNLKNARIEHSMTQKQVADNVGISLIYYQKIEQGTRVGDFKIWDALEGLLGYHQTYLREIKAD